MKKVIILFISISILSSCAPKIYSDSNISSVIANHQTIAILPPKVSIAAQKKVDAQSLIEQQKTESKNFQKEMYSWFLKRKSQGKLTIDIQDVETTNTLLTNLGYFEENTLTPSELAEKLNVDAVLTSNYSISKPMSEGAAIAVAVIFGVMGSTDKTSVDLSLHDKNTKKMVWNYNHKASGSFTNANELVDNLMRNASKKLPYIKK